MLAALSFAKLLHRKRLLCECYNMFSQTHYSQHWQVFPAFPCCARN
jgi:hypothetical protein